MLQFIFCSVLNSDYTYYEALKAIFMLCRLVTLHIIFVHFDKHLPDSSRDTCLAPEGSKRSSSGPWTKKVVRY